MNPDTDKNFMCSAITMARRGLGRTAPNPSVGCVIVNKYGQIISRARTADGGRPHAETIAIENAEQGLHGATVYVTLEPCAHHGQTSPCAQALVEAGVSRVVIGVQDCDPRVSGKGIKILEEAGIEVALGVLDAECKQLHQSFFTKILKNRPYVTLKTACTLDGKIATASGESKWITGEIARAHVHMLRAKHDAVLVGIETVLADDCALTVRGLMQNKPMIRIVLDSKLRIPLTCKLVDSSVDEPVWIFFDSGNSNIEKKKILERKEGVTLIPIDPKGLQAVTIALAERGITCLLVEGGATVHTSFMKAQLFDELLIYRAPKLIGSKAMSVFSDLDIDFLSEAHDLGLIDHFSLGKDSLEIYRPKE